MQTSNNGLIPGHAYSIIRAVRYEGHQLLNIRNPWGTFEWEGAWGDKDRQRWTPEAVEAVRPEFGDDGTFWMSFEDFTEQFRALNVCKVNDWEEVRVKGEFTNNDGKSRQSLHSKYIYEVTVSPEEGPQRLFIGVH